MNSVLKMRPRPGPLPADDAGDPELGGLEHALLFKKLPRPARKGGSLFQTAGLLKEELLQLSHRGVIEGAEPQIIGDGLLVLGDRRLPFAVEFDQLCIKPQLRRAEANQFLDELEGLLLREMIALGTIFPCLGVRGITAVMFSRDQLKRVRFRVLPGNESVSCYKSARVSFNYG